MLFQSEECLLTYIAPVDQFEAVKTALAQTQRIALDTSRGPSYPLWPAGGVWAQLIQPTTWNLGGTGIITEFDHRSTKVVVYEFVATRDGKQVPMVAFHCGYCHNSPVCNHDQAAENYGPQDRRWIGSRARDHMRPGHPDCRPVDPRIADAVTAVANDTLGTHHPVVTHESRCSITGPCSVLRHIRAAAR